MANRRRYRIKDISPRCLSLQDSAKYLGISETSMKSLIDAGEISYIQVRERGRITLEIKDLDAFIVNNKIRE